MTPPPFRKTISLGLACLSVAASATAADAANISHTSPRVSHAAPSAGHIKTRNLTVKRRRSATVAQHPGKSLARRETATRVTIPAKKTTTTIRPTASTKTTGTQTTTSYPAATSWSPLGEPGVGGRLTGLAVNPSNPQDVLVGGDMLGVGLSEDGGHTWQATTGFASWEINAFTWSTANAQEVWVGTMSGPYESVDGGHTWTSERVGLPTGDYPFSAPVQKVLIDATNPEHLLAFGGNQREQKAGGTGALNYGLVYESVDGGAQWSTIANIGTNWNILDVVAGTGNLQTLYATVLGHGVYKSTDGGHSWEPVDSGLPAGQVMALAGDPGSPGTVWAAASHALTAINGVYGPGGIYKTTDGGLSWVSESNGIPQNAKSSAVYSTAMYSIFRAGDGTLYTSDEGYADQNRYESTDGGADWTQAGGSFAKAFPAAATPYVWASSADGDFVIGGSMDTLMASTDHGASWYDTGSTQAADGGWRGNGFSGLLGTRVAFSPTRPGDVFLTAFDAGNLLHSTDGGLSWRRPLIGWDSYNGGYDVTVGGQLGNDIYEVLGQAGAFNGIAVSQDDGQTWTYQVGGTLPARHAVGSGQGSVAIASSDGATAYAVLPNEQVYVTTDTGSTWAPVSLGSPAFAVSASPVSHVVYVATSAGVYQITNQGTPVLMSASPTNLRRLVAANGSLYGAGPLMGGTQAGLWSNQNGSWARMATNHFVSDVAIDPTNSQRIVYVTNDNPYHDTSLATGVWISCNAGQTFSQYNNGLPMLRALSVAFDPWIPGRLVIGTNGRGYWQTQLPSC